MKNTEFKTLARKLNPETIEDAIAVQMGGAKIKTASFQRFGDKNNITNGLRLNWLSASGVPLDRWIKDLPNYDQDSFDQKEAIQRVVDFITEHPTYTDVRRYLGRRLETQLSRAAHSQPRRDGGKSDARCLVNHALQVLTPSKLISETTDYLAAPRSYFGELLDVPPCKSDLFSLPVSDQILIVKAMKKEAEKRLSSKGKSTVSPMKIKKSTKTAVSKSVKAKTVKKTTKRTFSAKQLEAQNKVKKMSRLADDIQYNAGERGLKKVTRGDALRKAAKQVYKKKTTTRRIAR